MLLWPRAPSVLNAAARLVYARRTSEHTTPLLRELNWLRVPEWIQFQLCVLAYHSVHGTAPAYLSDSLRPTSDIVARRCLRSADTTTLQVPSTRRATLGDRAFPVTAARAWNSLPLETRACSSLLIFRRDTKSHLFCQSYGWRGAVYSSGQQTSALSCATVLDLDFCKVPPQLCDGSTLIHDICSSSSSSSSPRRHRFTRLHLCRSSVTEGEAGDAVLRRSKINFVELLEYFQSAQDRRLAWRRLPRSSVRLQPQTNSPKTTRWPLTSDLFSRMTSDPTLYHHNNAWLVSRTCDIHLFEKFKMSCCIY